MKKLYLDFARFKPMRGRMYFPLPRELQVKRAIINVANNDTQCLKWALLSALHPVEQHPNRVAKYRPYEHELDFSNVDFPATLSDVNEVRSPLDFFFLCPLFIYNLGGMYMQINIMFYHLCYTCPATYLRRVLDFFFFL